MSSPGGAQFSKLLNKAVHQTIPCHRLCPESMSLDCKWCGSANLRMLAIHCEELLVENQVMVID